MDKTAVIKALQNCAAEGISLIDYLREKYCDQDPVIEHALEQMEAILKYSMHVHDEPADRKHQLYDN